MKFSFFEIPGDLSFNFARLSDLSSISPKVLSKTSCSRLLLLVVAIISFSALEKTEALELFTESVSVDKESSTTRGGLAFSEQLLASKSKTADKTVGTPSSASNVQAWEVNQSSQLVGPVSCLISSGAVRVRAEKMGITWLFCAPAWEANMYNTETRNYCSFPYEVWKNKVFFMPAARGADTQAKMKQMTVVKTGKQKLIAGKQSQEFKIKEPTGQEAGAIWMSNEVTAPRQFSEVIASMVNVPLKSGGAPLQLMMRQGDGKLKPVLDTESVKKVTVDKKLFEPLKGYKRVPDEMALLFADSTDSDS